MLAFGRKQALQAEPLDLNLVTGNLAKMLKRVIGAGIEIECAYATDRPFIQADLGMMEQVLVNLMVNARDAMPDGGRLIITTERTEVDEARARMYPEARAGKFVCWTVSDTGTGIPAEHLPHIFEPFYSTKESGRGTGLGLSTVYGIVKQHGGWVEVATRPGAGTTFKIFLPAIPVPATSEASLPSAVVLRGGDERILLVEGEPSVRMLTRRILETFGYEVLEAATGGEALTLAAAAAGEIDLLLTGLVMPDHLTGPGLAEELRKARPGLKVIFTSGHNLESARLDAGLLKHNQGFFLQKPCASRDLIDTVRRCLDAPVPVA